MSDDLNARVAVLESRTNDLHEDLATIEKDVKHIRSAIDQAKGGWKAWIAFGAASATIGAVLAKLGQKVGF